MPKLHVVRGRLVDLRRHVNVHLDRRSSFAPSERYELWIRPEDGKERQFIIHTRTMPVRRRHQVSLIVTEDESPQVWGLVNRSAHGGTNYLRTDPPPLLRLKDALVVSAIGGMLIWRWGSVGAALSIPAALTYLLMAGLWRALVRARRAATVDAQMAKEKLQSGVGE